MKLVYKVQGQHLTKTGMPPLELEVDKAAMEADLSLLAELDELGNPATLVAHVAFLAKYKLTSASYSLVSEYEQRPPKVQDKQPAT